MSHLFHAQANNNAWANYRLGQTCSRLSGVELAKDRQGFFGSIIATLNHILIVDWFYVSALEGACVGLSAFENLIPFPDIDDLLRAQRDVDARFVAVCDQPDAALAARPVTMLRGETEQVERFDRTFLHLIQHQIHHRGQVHGMLSVAGSAPPQLDEFYLAWEPDRALRKGDLAALGTSEDQIWK